MKLVKSPGPSNIIGEIIEALPNHCSQLIAVLDAIVEGKVPEEWYKSYIVSLFKDKGSALDRGNYRGLKLTHQVLKLVKRVIEKIIREFIVIDDMKFGFMPGRGKTYTVFIIRQPQENFLDKKTPFI